LWWFVLTNKLIHNNQFGFKRGKSVLDSLLYVDHLATRSLSLKRHLSIISLDFSKAFDKIGVHSIIQQLQEWQLGPRIINYVSNFMKNRKIIIKNGRNLSNSFPLDNGIPQGSPISVILFLISYNSLTKIIALPRQIKFTAYADDFHLIIEHNRRKNPIVDISFLFQEIGHWCSDSGASLLIEKYQSLHICRKHNCKSEIRTVYIPETNNTTILGLTLNNRYNWSTHINKLKTKLCKPLNIIKHLSSLKYNTNTSSLIHIVKSILILKIDYCLPIYGNSQTPN